MSIFKDYVSFSGGDGKRLSGELGGYRRRFLP